MTDKEWILWSLRKALGEWSNPLESRWKIYLAVKKSLQYAFLEGPITVTADASVTVWAQCLVELGVDLNTLGKIAIRDTTPECVFLDKILSAKICDTP